MKRIYDKMEQATHNLDLAIKLYFKKEHCGAILIAHGAEDVFNDYLHKLNKTSLYHKSVDKIMKSTGKTKREIKENYADRLLLWLKHGIGPDKLRFDKEKESIQYIIRAINGYHQLTHNFTKLQIKFIKLTSIKYPEKYKPKDINKIKTERPGT